MEMRAVLEVLRAVPSSEGLTVITDSKYTLNVFTEWIDGWRGRGWRTASGSRVENLDLIVTIDAELSGRSVTFEWVRGHTGHDLNERADRLANAAARSAAEAWLRE
jgi:ribonuclease HI